MKITNLLENTVASMPDPGQTAFRSGRSETSLEEMTAGGTVAGVVAPVSKPMGKVIKRESGIAQGIKKKMVDEGELSENDLILVPGQMSKRSKGFVSKDRNEMERIEMAKSDVVQSVKSATAIFSILKTSDDEIEGWVQEKLAKAEDYLDTVREYLEGKSMPAEGMSAGVRMQRALQREKEKRERSERYAEKHFPIGKKPEQNTEPQKEVKEGGQDWMDDMRAMAHKMAPQDKMNQAYAERQSQQQAKQQEQVQQDIENLPDLMSQFRDMKSEYESMGGSNWQYADNEQNLSDEERKARGMETSMRQLANRIRAAKEASEGLAESKPDFAKMFNKKIDKHNKAVVKTKKEIGTRVADIGAGGKEYNVKTDKEWDKQKGVTEVAPPGAKAERMVKHIKKSYAKDGKITPKEKSIAYATAWKAHNKGSMAEGFSLKKTNVDKYMEPGDPDEYTQDVNIKDTDYEIINNKTGQVVGTASWTTNDFMGPGALKITMKNGATRWLDIWASEQGNPQSAFNRFVKDPKTAKKYKEQGVAEGSLEEDKGMKQYWAFKREWRAKHGANARVPSYDSKEYNAYCWRQGDKEQGMAEGSMYGDEEVSWEKGGTKAPTGAFRNPAAKKVVFNGTGDDGGKYEVIQSGPDDYMIHANGKHIDTYPSLHRAMSVLKNEVSGLKKTVDEESKGLWANIHAKRERIKHGSGEKMRKPGSKGAPTADALRKSAK